MSAVTVAVQWGPRPETPREQADRWLDLLTRLTDLSGGKLGDWRWDTEGDEPGPLVPADAAALAAALQEANTDDDVDIIGWSAQAVGRRADGGYLRLWIQAGGSNGHSPFFAVLNLFPGTGRSGAPLADRLAEVLAATAGAWDADTGLVYDRELFKAVKREYGLPASRPRTGWSVFLSASRVARIPGDFPARRLPADHDGLVLDLADVPGGTPTTETVLAAHKALADSGALEPRPVPATRPKL
ncbi:hypothetical protein OHB14_27215 [Streptomyces sp. NBC_01613]|uniref:hypothetical protein n=1 Tax=Streptomyces sp. NBC_01613 TaxID=2975896 RepID=UPI00386415C0